MATPQTRAASLSLYRALFRASRTMPTSNRTLFVQARTRSDFRANLNLISLTEIEGALVLGETCLDSANVQGSHLTKVWALPGYHKEASDTKESLELEVVKKGRVTRRIKR